MFVLYQEPEKEEFWPCYLKRKINKSLFDETPKKSRPEKEIVIHGFAFDGKKKSLRVLAK